MHSLLSWIRRYAFAAQDIPAREKARSAVGAIIGIALTAILGRLLIDTNAALPWIIAPMGASAVLLFAVPASPLAQPWSVLGGNVLSALIGIASHRYLGDPVLAAAVAVSAAIAAMFYLRCLHPPGGAVALMTALGVPGMDAHGFAFALSPVAINSVALILIAIAYNRLCGRRYPHLAQEHKSSHGTTDTSPLYRSGVVAEDLDAVLRRSNELLDINRSDLEEIVLKAEMHAYHRRFGRMTCADIMSRDLVKAEFGTELHEAWGMLRDHTLHALPVVNRYNRIIGIVTQHDFLREADQNLTGDFADRLRRLLSRPSGSTADRAEVVGQIMTADPRVAQDTDPIATLVPLLCDLGLHHIPIVDANQRLVGMVSQTDMVSALYHASFEQPVLPAAEIA